MSVIGKDNIMFKRGEDMDPQVANATGGLMDCLSEFTGLDHEGVNAVCGKKESTYKVSSNLLMLPETQQMQSNARSRLHSAVSHFLVEDNESEQI
eukprot:scaffold5357_cov208-Amphora_coffeaeformis.AAC.13